ncbi:MAG: primosomal protein N' [Deltaproteobacteria bacterium]|nr:primosomal protein N' [Deltaproteobacteria bacterium]
MSAVDRREMCVETAVALTAPGTYHYRIPEDWPGKVSVGTGLVVPFGRRHVSAFVLHTEVEAPVDVEVLPAIEPLATEPFFGPLQVRMFEFMARYYLAPIGEVVRTALPAGILQSTQRIAEITDAGRAALREEGSVREALMVLLEALAEEPPGIAVASLPKRVPTFRETQLRTLVRDGLVLTHVQMRMPAICAKTIAMYAPATGANLEEARAALVRSPKRLAVLEAVVTAGRAVTGGEIADLIDADPRAHLRALAAAGWFRIDSREVYRQASIDADHQAPPVLNAAQGAAVRRVCATMDAREHRTFVLHGVTGSGKTEVYLRLVERALAAGRPALVLVPEIALTPQLVGRFVGRFGDAVGASHSGLAPGERYDLWRRVRRREKRVVIGARSAIFAPFDDLGVVVVDEEHDGSYKQDDALPYNARDLAIWLGRETKCPVVLGSATPSMETFHGAKSGRYELLELRERVHGRGMPPVSVVDLRPLEKELARKPRSDRPGDDLPHARMIFSPSLATALRENLEAGEQTILLLNRRGYSTHVFCLACGASAQCLDCDVSLTFHASRQKAVCHYCDREYAPPRTCRVCGGERLFYAGLGTEQVEHEIARLFPSARVVRMDRDTVAGREGHQRVLTPFRRGEADILLGTQMVAKGHDFPNVTLVGVLQADSSLSMPDFRAAERTFQLVTQVSGRAGRAEAPGRIVMQTYNPDHYAVTCASGHDFERFYELEINRRKVSWFPPFARTALVRVSGPDRDAARSAALAAAKGARKAAKELSLEADAVLGPARSMIARVKNRFRFQVFLRAQTPADLHRLIAAAKKAHDRVAPSTLAWRVDMDPQSVV